MVNRGSDGLMQLLVVVASLDEDTNKWLMMVRPIRDGMVL